MNIIPPAAPDVKGQPRSLRSAKWKTTDRRGRCYLRSLLIYVVHVRFCHLTGTVRNATVRSQTRGFYNNCLSNTEIMPLKRLLTFAVYYRNR